MPTLARVTFTVVDDAGNIQPEADITVQEEAPGLPPAACYEDRAGLSSLGSAFNADVDGVATFCAAGGLYRITASLGAFSRTWTEVPIGTAAEHDSDYFITAAEAADLIDDLGTAGLALINGKIVESHSGNAATFAIKTLAGTDPAPGDAVKIAIRNAAGGCSIYSIEAALSFTFSSGSTAGFVSGAAGRLWFGLIDTGSAVVFGAINCSTATQVFPLAEWLPITTVAEGGAGAADSAGVMYSAAAQTAKNFAIIGFADYDSGLATAGTWNASPSRIVLFGPGVPRPGQIVQMVPGTSGAVVNNATATPVATNTLVTITPTSKINLVRVQAVGSMYASPGVNNHFYAAQISRGTGPTLIGNSAAIFADGVNNGGGVVNVAIDKPQTTSAQIYKVYTFADGALAQPAAYPWTAGAATIEAQEIMG